MEIRIKQRPGEYCGIPLMRISIEGISTALRVQGNIESLSTSYPSQWKERLSPCCHISRNATISWCTVRTPEEVTTTNS